MGGTHRITLSQAIQLIALPHGCPCCACYSLCTVILQTLSLPVQFRPSLACSRRWSNCAHFATRSTRMRCAPSKAVLHAHAHIFPPLPSPGPGATSIAVTSTVTDCPERYRPKSGSSPQSPFCTRRRRIMLAQKPIMLAQVESRFLMC